MMKSKDCGVATALIIQGYLAANDALQLNPGDAFERQRGELTAVLAAIRQECTDWAENIESHDAALEPDAITVELLEASGGAVSRSPYNLLSAALVLAGEAVDLDGPESIDNLIGHLSAFKAKVSAR